MFAILGLRPALFFALACLPPAVYIFHFLLDLFGLSVFGVFAFIYFFL